MNTSDPFADIAALPKLDRVKIGDNELRAGQRVRLRPLGRGDIMDIALDGMPATIVSIEQDFENRIHFAVTLDDDPGRDLGASGLPGHRFFFGVDEIEILQGNGKTP